MIVHLPPPLTPRTADLRGFSSGIINVAALLDALRRGNHIARADMALKLASLDQLPAGSLPNDDDTLRSLSGLTPQEYRAKRDRLLADWVLCSDGRLYHAGIAALVMDSMKRFRRSSPKPAKSGAALEKRGQMRLALDEVGNAASEPEKPAGATEKSASGSHYKVNGSYALYTPITTH